MKYNSIGIEDFVEHDEFLKHNSESDYVLGIGKDFNIDDILNFDFGKNVSGLFNKEEERNTKVLEYNNYPQVNPDSISDVWKYGYFNKVEPYTSLEEGKGIHIMLYKYLERVHSFLPQYVDNMTITGGCERGGHSSNSKHYQGLAIDIDIRDDNSDGSMELFFFMITDPMLREWGFRILGPNHGAGSHIHLEYIGPLVNDESSYKCFKRDKNKSVGGGKKLSGTLSKDEIWSKYTQTEAQKNMIGSKFSSPNQVLSLGSSFKFPHDDKFDYTPNMKDSVGRGVIKQSSKSNLAFSNSTTTYLATIGNVSQREFRNNEGYKINASDRRQSISFLSQNGLGSTEKPPKIFQVQETQIKKDVIKLS